MGELELGVVLPVCVLLLLVLRLLSIRPSLGVCRRVSGRR